MLVKLTLTVLFILVNYIPQLPDSPGVVIIDRYDKAIDEEDEADSEENNEVG
jgi:hypothetical protein